MYKRHRIWIFGPDFVFHFCTVKSKCGPFKYSCIINLQYSFKMSTISVWKRRKIKTRTSGSFVLYSTKHLTILIPILTWNSETSWYFSKKHYGNTLAYSGLFSIICIQVYIWKQPLLIYKIKRKFSHFKEFQFYLIGTPMVLVSESIDFPPLKTVNRSTYVYLFVLKFEKKFFFKNKYFIYFLSFAETYFCWQPL